MKRIYYILLAALALVAFHPGLSAQPGVTIGTDGNPSEYKINDKGIGYAKAITGPDNKGNYLIHLHTFVTGNGTVTHSYRPADVVLVLDVSGSMDENMTTTTYTERSSQAYSYTSYGNNSYYYKHTDGNYYQVRRDGRRLYFSVGSGWNTQYFYLYGTGVQNTRPNQVPDNNSTIWTGVLYSMTSVTEKKITALKRSVKSFIDLIKANDDDGQGGSLENTISIVKFGLPNFCDENGNDVSYEVGAADATATGIHRRAASGNRNYTEIVLGPTLVSTGYDDLIGAIDQLVATGYTAADYGMKKAELVVNTFYEEDGVTPKRESNKTVVFFTDGDPNHQNGFDNTVANATIKNSKSIKAKLAYTDEEVGPVNVSVYSVSVFDGQNNNRTTYMNRVSSNYPTAEDMTSSSSGTTGGKYYQDASSGNLEDVFRSIANEAGGNSSLNSSTITAVDVVSQSFDIPDDAGDIEVYEVKVLSVSDGTLTFDSFDEWVQLSTDDYVERDENNPNKITVTGFDYAANYCGTLTVDDEDPVPHGSKLVLRIPITMSDDAVGGPGVDTNGPESGIYLDGKNELKFESPIVDLPVNLQIKKVDLQLGESAKFKIQRTPKANTPSASSTWEDVTTIFVTRTADNAEPDVYVRGLDPNYHYRILEEDWGWSYNFVNASGEGYIVDSATNEKHVGIITITDKTEVTSDKFVSNPITFKNSKKTKIEAKVHHAESKAKNTFNGTDPVYVDSKTNTRNQNSGTQTN